MSTICKCLECAPGGGAIYDCPDRNGLDGVQSVTYVCHGLDNHPGQSRIGCPIRDWDWTHFKIIQSQSQIGCPIRDWDWTLFKIIQT